MSTEEKLQVPKELQKISLEEAKEVPEEIESESQTCDGPNSHKWDNKMEVQRRLSGKPNLEIEKKKTVLFVDDDEVILCSLERGLLNESYNKLYAKSGKEALKVLKRKEVHVIVTDMCMPKMSGLELLRIARKKYPSIIGLVLTGYEPNTELRNAIKQGEIFWLLPKPLWKLGGKFERLVLRALNRFELQSESNTVRR